MGRKRTLQYNQTIFAKKITELQEHYNYTNEYVCRYLTDEFGGRLINDVQTLDNYKIGKRIPRDFHNVIVAFAKFYNVTTDYLLGVDNIPNRNVQRVCMYTGLSPDAVNKLIQVNKIKSEYPEILQLIEALLIGSNETDITLFSNLYNQLFDDYKNEKNSNTSHSCDIEKIKIHMFFIEEFYNHIKDIVIQHLSPIFDNKIKEQEDLHYFQHSDEYISSLPNTSEIDSDYNIKLEDGTKKELRAERHK